MVHVRGPLEHHEDWGDSYDCLLTRVRCAFSGEDQREKEAWKARMRAWRNGEDEEAAQASIVATPPRAVVLCLDSPGGVVSGLQETAKAIRKVADEAGLPFYAYLNEMATSAAYALACACDEIYLPASGIAGSVGVISTMVDQVAADEKMGIRVVTLTSGARKADGHPHVAISDEAVEVEQGRVDALARQFFRHVSARRGLSVAKVASYEAGIFLGQQAVDAGLVDAVMGWDAFLSAIDGGSATDRIAPREKAKAKAADPSTRKSMLKLRELVASTEKAIKAEKSQKKREELERKLAAYKMALADSGTSAKTTHTIEHKERHVADDGDEDDVDDGSEDDDEEDDEEEEAAEGNETDRGDEPEDDEDEEEEEASSYSEEEEASSSKALRAALSGVKDKKLRAQLEGTLAAMADKASKYDALGARVETIEKKARAREKSTLIARALSQHRITPGQARQLSTKKMNFVKGYLDMHKKALVNTDRDDLAEPEGESGEEASAKVQSLGADLDKLVARAVSASNGKLTREQFIADYERDRKKSGKAGGY